MKRLALLIGLVASANVFAADTSLCFAFLRAGDVVVSCEGQEFWVGETGNINSYAIAEEQGVLAVVRCFQTQQGTFAGQGPPSLQSVQITAGSQGSSCVADMVDLRTAKNRIAPRIPTVMSTCGSVFAVSDSNRQPVRKDLLTGIDVPFDAYTWFRCSADRKVVAGIVESDRALYEGLPPQTKVAGAGSAAHYEFNISPNGSYVAYASDRQPLCVWSANGGTQCAAANMIDTSHDLVSVRDDGDVLVAMATADKCVYESPAVYKPAKPNDKKASSCIGIGQWHVGMGSPEIVEAVGREPQWISPATANLLKAWARKSKAYF